MLLFQHLLIVYKALGVRPCDSGLLTTYLHHAGVAASAYGHPPGSVDGFTCSTGCPLRGLYRVGPRLSLNSSGENVATSDPRYIARGKKTRHGPSNLIGQITGIGGCFPSHLLLATETRFRRALSPYLVSLSAATRSTTI